MKTEKPVPEFMVRVKLPSGCDYWASPSGDTAFEEAFDKALAEATPPGFNPVYPRGNECWPVDSEGFTFVRLQCTDEKSALAYWMAEAQKWQAELRRIKKAILG